MNITRKPLFWLSFVFLSIASIIFSFKYFSTAFPIVNLELTCNREQALAKAQELARTYHLGPINASETALFWSDQEVQIFVELEAGGKEAFAQMLKDHYYSPYQWYIRLFHEYDKNETIIRLKPDGTPYGFVQELSENDKGAALEQDAARALAENAAPAWNINLSEYKLVEQSKEAKLSGRVDHSFVYERPDIRIGEGYYRLKLGVSGDKVTEVTQFVKVPEAFTLKYKEMRSANNSLAAAAKLAMMLLYILGCCIIALFLLVRRNNIIWWPAIGWGVFIGFLHFLVELNQLPLYWFEYPTALSMQGYLLKLLVALLYQFISLTGMYCISFIAAENLTRAAFGNHPQLWRAWDPGLSNSFAVIGRTIAGYLLVPVELAFSLIFCIVSTTIFGWWNPSSALIDPNVLASYFPWLSSIVYSLGAGFWEECLFRAVPLATAALIGQRWGNKRAWIIGAFIIQIIIFGAAHANYAAQPAYARVVELIFFSTLMGLIYLRFGLIPTIIAHFTVDVVWFSLPVFMSSGAGTLLNKIMIILLTAIPLFVCLYGRYKKGTFQELASKDLNSGWQPPVKRNDEKVFSLPQTPTLVSLHKYIKPGIILGGILGAGLLFTTLKKTHDAPALGITPAQAIIIANQELARKKIALPETWEPLRLVSARYDENPAEESQHQWIWQQGGQDLYRSFVGSYLKPPRVVVRYATFSQSVPVAQRAEEYLVTVFKDGSIGRVRHILPETKPGASLEENEARTIAQSALEDLYNLDAQTVKEVSASADKKPARKDWTFIFENKAVYPLNEGQARIVISIAGDQIVDALRYIHVPEKWEREEQNKKNLIKVLEMFCMLLLYLVFCLGLLVLFKRMHNFNYLSRALKYFVPLAVLFIINLINGWPSVIAVLNTTEPLRNQLFMVLARYGLISFIKAAGCSFVLAGIFGWRLPYKPHTHWPLLFGACIGLLAAGLYSLADALSPALHPEWAKYDELSNYLPWLGEICSAIITYISITAVILLVYIIVDYITDYWRRKKWLGGLTFLGIGILLNGAQSMNTINLWLIGGVGIGLLLLTIYLIIARYDRKAVPIITGVLLATQLAQQAFFNAYPGAMIGYTLAIIAVLLLAYAWSVAIEKNEIIKQ